MVVRMDNECMMNYLRMHDVGLSDVEYDYEQE